MLCNNVAQLRSDVREISERDLARQHNGVFTRTEPRQDCEQNHEGEYNEDCPDS